jgi:hypothetical protein
MAIKGSLKEASLADVCQLLALGLKSGCLSVADGSRFGQIYFERGRITYARIVNRRDRLGDILVRDRVLAQSQLDEVLHPAADRGGHLSPLHLVSWQLLLRGGRPAGRGGHRGVHQSRDAAAGGGAAG